MPPHLTMRKKPAKPKTTRAATSTKRTRSSGRRQPPPQGLNPLWSFKSDAWRAYAFTVWPLCALLAVAVIAPHAQDLSFAALAALVGRLFRP